MVDTGNDEAGDSPPLARPVGTIKLLGTRLGDSRRVDYCRNIYKPDRLRASSAIRVSVFGAPTASSQEAEELLTHCLVFVCRRTAGACFVMKANQGFEIAISACGQEGR
jgi:hypothetical protein